MSPEMTEQTLQLFKEVYGPQILEDSALKANLQRIVLTGLKIGQPVPRATIRADERMILLKGKLRVLERSESGQERTTLHLTPGDIWDGPILDNPSRLLIVSSHEAVLATLPSIVVAENATLQRHWSAIQQKVMEQQPAFVVPEPASVLAGFDNLPMASAVTDAPELETEHALQTTTFINQVLAYFNQPPLPANETVSHITDMQSLSRTLKSYGLEIQPISLNWPQLLNTTYPLVLEDEQKKLRWITGRKGNTLLEPQGDDITRYMASDISATNTFNVLLVKLPSRKIKRERFTPYSFAWYVHLCYKSWFLSTQMVVASILVQLFALGMPIFYMIIFDRVFGRQNLSTLDVMTAGIMMLMTFDVMVKLLRAYIMSHQLEWIDKVGLESILNRLFDIPLSKSGGQANKGFADRFPELIRINQVFVMTLQVTSLDVLFSSILVVALFMLHPQLAFISLAPLIPVALLSFWTTPMVKKRALKNNQDQRVCQLKISEVLENNETIKSINAEKHVKWSIDERIEEHLQRGFGARFDRINGAPVQAFIAGAGTVVTLYFGAHEVLQGEISYGVYMAMTMISRQVVSSIQRMFSSLIQFQEAVGLMEQIRPLFNEEEADQKRNSQGAILHQVAGHIRMVDLRFRYQPEGNWILKDINLDILPGQKIVITGKSGSGKTTLMRLLQRLYEPNDGYITLDGFNIADIDVENLRSHVGVALQKPGIFAGSIRENIAIGNPIAPMKDIIEAANMTQLDQVLIKLPQGIDSRLAPMGHNMSGGQIAQIALARVLLIKPSILVMDEATNACDPALNAAIFNHILQKYKDSTCIFITDYLPMHVKADRIIVLNDGQVVEQGTYQELSRMQGYYSLLHLAGRALER